MNEIPLGQNRSVTNSTARDVLFQQSTLAARAAIGTCRKSDEPTAG